MAEGAAGASCQRRVLELAAVLSMYEAALTEVFPPDYLEAAQAMCQGDMQAADTFAAAHSSADIGCSGMLQLRSNGGAPGPSTVATLAFSMPAGYPGAEALQCHVVSSSLARSTVDALSHQLQQQARAATGSECLFDLAEALTSELDKQQALQADAHQNHQQQQHQQVTAAADDDSIRHVLLRLDHMRDRPAYTATVKQWAAELQLTGWLLLWQSLILILLEGRAGDVGSYLRRARTVCVDVDALGRKCRERMMSILEDSADATVPGGNSNGRGGSSSGACSATHTGSDGCGQPAARLPRHYSDFREVHANSLKEVAAQLSDTHPSWNEQALRALLRLGSCSGCS